MRLQPARRLRVVDALKERLAELLEAWTLSSIEQQPEPIRRLVAVFHVLHFLNVRVVNHGI